MKAIDLPPIQNSDDINVRVVNTFHAGDDSEI